SCRFLFIGEPAHHKIGGRAKMANIRQAGQTRTVGRIVLGLAVALVAGCSNTPTMPNQQQKVDPLLHGVPPAPSFPNQTPGAAPTQPTQPQAFNMGGVPAIPALHSPTNN